ncbi:MAG: purine-nucleoside phosphorylase [Erysipelotrichaceae bacterium]|nr:purine-nucleoside phosphorylase [Erysipelotrichaceae bacterium]
MSTPHNSAAKEQIAKSVLMPGDPLRAKFIAETFLDEPVLVNPVRGINGYTGSYKGVPVTVMASGMGMPSIGIYSYELFKFYDVENIIRVGSAGAYDPELHVYDVVIADSAYSESTFAKTAFHEESDILLPSAELNQKLKNAAAGLNVNARAGRVHSSDVFYHDGTEYMKTVVEEKGCSVVEMESFALFANAKYTGKNAACILTVSDSLVNHEDTTPEERQNSFTTMMKIALEAAIAE